MTARVDPTTKAGFLLDRQWHWLRGETEHSKRPALLALARVLHDAAVPYAIIGGLAVQVHQNEPPTTLDIDVAVLARQEIPRVALESAGFRPNEASEHSENWRAADGTPVQFTDDPHLAEAVRHAEPMRLEDVELRILRLVDLFHEKLRAGVDPARRRSTRLRDLVDAQTLLEEHPELDAALTDDERHLLDQLPQ